MQQQQPERAVDEIKEEVASKNVPERQQVRRGRRFVRVYVALLILATVGFIALALLARGTTLLNVDRPLMRDVQSVHWPLYRWALTHESDLGFPPLNTVSYVVVFVALALAGRRFEAVLGVGSSLLADLVGSVIKQVVRRARPSGPGIVIAKHLGGYSFPSGHVMQYVTLFGFAFYVVLVSWRGGLLRAAALVLLALLVLLVGPSRVYLGEHWPSDVTGAYLLAGLWLAGTIELHILLRARFGGAARHD